MDIFLDFDGTLAEYKAENLEQFYEEGYYLKLEPYKILIEFLKKLSPYVNLYVISACVNSRATDEKQEWIDKYFPEIPFSHRFFCQCGINKAKFIEETMNIKLNGSCILLDDYSPNCLEWEEAGGIAIKVSNGKNCSGNNWKGLTISAFREECI